MSDAGNASPTPKVFLSYSWSSEAHKELVRSWANRLLGDHIDVVIDVYDLKEGDDKHAFMERSVRDATVSHVLIVCDEVYAQKADARQAGVGTETQLISKEVYDKVVQSKFIPIICQFDKKGQPYLPAFLASRIGIDFSTPEKTNANWERLVRRLTGKPRLVKPSLGRMPAYLSEGASAPPSPTGAQSQDMERARRSGLGRYRKAFFDACSEYLLSAIGLVLMKHFGRKVRVGMLWGFLIIGLLISCTAALLLWLEAGQGSAAGAQAASGDARKPVAETAATFASPAVLTPDSKQPSSEATSANPPHPVGGPQPPPNPRKHYAASEKVELDEALAEVKRLMNTSGSDIVAAEAKNRQSLGDLGFDARRVSLRTTGIINDQMNSFSSQLMEFQNALAGPNGVLSRHRAYKDELNQVLQPFPDEGKFKAITDVESGVEYFRQGLRLLERVLASGKLDDKHAEDTWKSTMTFRSRLGEDVSSFQKWMDDVRGRIETMRQEVIISK